MTCIFRAPDETDSEFRARILANLEKQPMKCPECNDTRVYVGLGLNPPEPCRACSTPYKTQGDARVRHHMPVEQAGVATPQEVTGPTYNSVGHIPKLAVSSLSDDQYLVRAESEIKAADLAHVPTTDLQSFANWVQASMKEGRPTCKYAVVQSIDRGWSTTSVKLRIDNSNPNGRALVARLDAMAFNGDFRQACSSWSGETPWMQVNLEWLNPIKVELTREQTTHELATRQLPPIKVELPIRGFRSSDEHRRFVGHLTAEVLKALAAIPKVNYSGSVKSDTCPKSQPITDAELMKLIDQAVKSGQNLDALIKERTLAKDGVPPVITLHVTY